MTRVLLIDNYDSFTYNLVQAMRAQGAAVDVRRNDQITTDEAIAISPTHLVISPGPGGPRDAGVSMEMIRALAGRVPVLGVCLGHQAMAEVFGGRVGRADRLMHGKSSQVFHDSRGVYIGLPNPMTAGRYHSLAVSEMGVPPEFVVTSRTEVGEIMGIRHRRFACEGVQFHPESVLTPEGERLLRNFLDMCEPRAPGVADQP
ncbi:MAG: aminodeoxychorismate/anthranilate synthase component II [Phycisphaerae bacterium]|nr:aminodeoxychorismate/anthranilate synthase component II [Phycisphaerae bacterium]